MPDSVSNPAEQAAEASRARVYSCIDNGKSFLLEAGAGAGKTYSLIRVLRYIISKRGIDLRRRHQHVACISYTNVATEEIKARTDGHPAVLPSTIHAFFWSLIQDFQPQLRERLPQLPGWPERLAEAGDIAGWRIGYELGYPKVQRGEKCVLLGHNDVISLAVALMGFPKFRRLMAARYPIVLIDEYQDTNADIANALKSHFLDAAEGPLIGFFGDHWQKIYGDGCGRIEHSALAIINKEANFRSVPAIVGVLNRMRTELPQEVTDPNATGFVAVFHSNDWTGTRLTGQHWGGDLPADAANERLEALVQHLARDGWSFEPDKTKILILTHKSLAEKQGYRSFASIFPYNDAYIKKEDSVVAFLLDMVEPVCTAYESGQFGAMFAALGGGTPTIRSHADKMSWATDMCELLQLRSTGTVGAVLDHVRRTKRPCLPDAVERRARELDSSGTNDEHSPSVEQLRKLRDVPYHEVRALDRFVDGHTPFSTKHGVKGAEFENVLAVFGRGWNQYDFNQMLEWAGTRVPPGRRDVFERNRNLFYVACSRPKKRLALLFTQKLSGQAMRTLTGWFGEGNIRSMASI